MTAYRKLINIIFWLGLILWISALVSAAIAAMNVFPTMDRLPLELERYPQFPVADHPRLAASHVMDGVFFTVDMLQFIAVPIVVITFILQATLLRTSRTRMITIVRGGCILIAAGLFAYHATLLAPNMNRELRARWLAAEQGNVESAAAHRDNFERGHRIAQPLMQFNLLLLVIASIASATAISPAANSQPSHPGLETPKLARGKR